MKTIICLVLPALLIMLLILACEKENNNTKALSGKLIATSPCKSNKSTRVLTETPDTLSCIEYAYNSSENLLSLKHINAGFNCCPDSIHCDIKFKGDSIIITESEEKAQCNCNCLYDLDMEVYDVEAKTYHIKLIEPYAGDLKKLIFSINIGNVPEGSFCVTRKQYPWIVYE